MLLTFFISIAKKSDSRSLQLDDNYIKKCKSSLISNRDLETKETNSIVENDQIINYQDNKRNTNYSFQIKDTDNSSLINQSRIPPLQNRLRFNGRQKTVSKIMQTKKTNNDINNITNPLIKEDELNLSKLWREENLNRSTSPASKGVNRYDAMK